MVQMTGCGRAMAGKPNLKITLWWQEVEYVKEEAKMVYLLECLQKTPPPVSAARPGWGQSP